jgi:TRAP-type transport system small permease protein
LENQVLIPEQESANEGFKPINRVARVASWVANGALLVVMAIIVANALGRAFGYPIYGYYNWIELLMVVVVILTIAFTEVKHSHLSVTMFYSKFPHRLKIIADVFILLLTLGTIAVIAWQASVLAFRSTVDMERVGNGLIVAPFRWLFVFGFVLYGLVVLFNFLKGER